MSSNNLLSTLTLALGLIGELKSELDTPTLSLLAKAEKQKRKQQETRQHLMVTKALQRTIKVLQEEVDMEKELRALNKEQDALRSFREEAVARSDLRPRAAEAEAGADLADQRLLSVSRKVWPTCSAYQSTPLPCRPYQPSDHVARRR